MEHIKVLVTHHLLEERQDYLDQMASISPKLKIKQRTCNTPDETAAALEDVEILFTRAVPSHLNCANRLKWVQLSAAGIDKSTWSPIFDPDRGTIVTSAAGVHAVPMAEYCITTMSMLVRGFLQLFRDKLTKTRDRTHSPPVELWGQTLGIVGYGHMGRELARLASAHHMRILALKRNPNQRHAWGYQWQGVGDLEGTLPQRFFGPDQLHELLRQSDFVVNCLPLTGETHDLFGKPEFQAMKSSAYFINVGRGKTVNEIALTQALQKRVIAGAALDVWSADPDPLPPDNPLWELDNVFISPHISGTRFSTNYLERISVLFCDNLRRYVNDEPLFNVVTRDRGY
jgi:phosphoglycerate dehydrogenase-like enzyme